MKKLITTILLLVSVQLFSQESIKTHKAKNVETTILEQKTASTKKSSSSKRSSTTARTGTVNGSIVADLSVSGSGGVNYTVPINVPPGLNNVQPDIALTFDSQSGNGLAGWGWNLSGVSVITRIPATQFHNGFIDPVDFDANDRFALDGQRLVLKSGTYGSSGAVYETEQHSNLKVVSYGSNNGLNIAGPKYFKVFYPDGSIGHYGSTLESRGHMDYALTYWENPQGIRVSYTYSKSENSLYIEKISYGSKGTSSPINEIEFSYDNDRMFDESAYVGGVRFVRDKILDQILVRGAGGVLYREYVLNHSSTTLGYERLTSLTEKVSGDSRSISFQYDSNSNTGLIQSFGEASQLDVAKIEQRNAKVISLNLNANGKMDFVVYPTFGESKKTKFWFFEDVQNSSGFNYSDAVETGFFQDIFPVNWLNEENRLMPNQGLVLVKKIGGRANFNIMAKPTPSASSISTIYNKTWDLPTTYNYFNQQDVSVPQKYLSGDFDGDGLSDMLAVANPLWTQFEIGGQQTSQIIYNTPKTHLIKLDRRDGSEVGFDLGQLSGTSSETNELYAVDVNGDGKTDLVRFSDGKAEVYSINNNNTEIELLWEYTNSVFDAEFKPMPGDYNGDGKTDFLIPRGNNSNHFSMLLSTGSGFDKKEYLQMPFEYKHTDFDSQEGTLYGYNIIPVDMNGDGKTDIIEYNTETYNGSDNGKQFITLFQSKPPSSGSYPHFSSTGQIDTQGNLKHYPIPIFLSSNEENGNLEFATMSDKWVRSYKSIYDHREDVTLEKVTNNGVVTDIKYDLVNTFYTDSGSDSSFFKSYTASSQNPNQVFPYENVDVAPSFMVVRELLQTGSGHTRTKRFYYENAISTTNGQGFAGFEMVKRSNWFGNNVPAVWTISKHNPLLRGAVIEQITSSSNSTNPTQYASKINYFYDYQLIDNPSFPSVSGSPPTLTFNSPVVGSRVDEAAQSITLLPGFQALGANGDYTAKINPPINQSSGDGYAGAVDIRLNRMESDNGLTGVLTTETYTYDQYNNQTKINTVFPGGSRIVDYTYYNSPSATNNTYHIGKIKLMSETMTSYGNSFTTEEEYEYNNNLVSKIKRKGDGTAWLIQDLEYDIYGNVTKKTLKGTTKADRVQQFEYEPNAPYYGRFLTKSIEVDGLATTFEYDPVDGGVISTTSPYSLTTSFLHDNWGRIWKETDYRGNETIRSYSPLSGGALKYTVDYPTGAKDETYYNAFGWTTRSGSLSLNNQWVYNDYEYYVSGRLRRESEPHNGSPGQWNTTVFDEYGRPISEQLYTGRNITISYSGLSSTVNDGVKTVTTTLDALGNVAKSQDPGGTIDYTYHASGQLKTADYGGHVVTVGVDGWGRKISLNDPSAGTYTYSYHDDFGDLWKEITPKGTTTYEYDDFGRIDSKTVVGDLTDLSLDYVYDPNTQQLTDINGYDNTNNNRAYTYEYEYHPQYKYLEKVTENTGLASFELEMTYDGYDRVETETQTSSLTSGASKSLTTRNVYDTSGILKEIWNNGTPDKLWELNEINARGQGKTITLGNGIVKSRDYDGYGYLEKIEDKESGNNPTPTVALYTEYDFNAQRGTLNSRENFGFNWQEVFGYDQHDRLTTITGDVIKTMAYDNRGRIDDNTDIGDYTYATPKDYRLNEIDPNTKGETFFQQYPTQQISYNAFKKPVTIHQTGHGRVSFEYGPMMNRSTAYYGGEDEDRSLRRYRKHYSSIIPVEIVEDTQTSSAKIINYVAGDAYSAPIAHIKETGANSIDEYHYLHRDYLGSILAITDADGDVKEQSQFGAWGELDKFLDSSGGTTFDHTSLLGRGYTGHEHFFEVGLIHMNGRMYDANLGRFLSPDNYIVDPFNTQAYNRYGYVLNNPLMYTDPSGEEPIAIIVAAVAALIFANAIFGNHDANPLINDGYLGSSPTPVNNQNNTQMASSMSRQSRGNGSLNDGGWIPLNIPAIEAPSGGGIAFDNMSFQSGGAFGISQTGSADPLQGVPVPDNFVPNDGLDDQIVDQGFNITAEDVLDTALDFVPIVGGAKDIYKGIRDGDGWMVALGVGSIIADVFTLGGSSIAKGAIKTGIKAGGRVLSKKALTNKQLVQKAANLANRNVRNIRSTARGTGTAKHSHASELLRRYQRRYGDRGLRVNDYFNNNTLLGPGNRGFLDVRDIKNNKIYDWKFGKAGWSPGQSEKYQGNFFDYTLELIRPQ